MSVVLKAKDKEIYIKSVDWTSGKVEFTENHYEAKAYRSDWFADAERVQLQHYATIPYEKGGLCGDHVDEIKDMSIYFT
jgi:hypothetical protein